MLDKNQHQGDKINHAREMIKSQCIYECDIHSKQLTKAKYDS